MTLRTFSQNGNSFNATWGEGDKFASLISGHRGGCLYCSEIKLWQRGTGRSKYITSTMGFTTEEAANEPTLIRYIESLWNAHLG